MSDLDTLVFPNQQGFAVPEINGFFDHDFVVTAEPVEGGYIGGSQLSLGGAGIPPVVFRGVRDAGADRIVLAFLCRFTVADSGQGDSISDDSLVIALKPQFAGVDTSIRLIEIRPIEEGGAIGGAGEAGADGLPYDIRRSRVAADVDCYKWTGSWQSFAQPAGIDIKVRSWNPTPALAPGELAWSVEVSLPRTIAGGGGADWIDIQNHFAFFFAVHKIVPVGGGMAAQYRFPLNSPDFVGFSTFLLPSEISFGHGIIPDLAGPPLPAGVEAQGVRFRGGWQGIGRRQANSGATTLGHLIYGPHLDNMGNPVNPPDLTKNNEIVAFIENTGTVQANDVRADFRFANWGLPSEAMWHQPLNLQPNPAPAAAGPDVNVAPGGQADIVANWPRQSVPSQYNGKHLCVWAQLSGGGGTIFMQSSVRRNMDFTNLSADEREAEVSGEGYEEPADGSGEHKFVLQTFCRKIVVPTLIEHRRSIDPETLQLVGATLQHAKEEQDDGQDDRRRLAEIATMRRVAASATQQYQNSTVHIWVTEGFRITTNTVNIGGRAYPLLDTSSGAFGLVAHHQGIKDNLSWSLVGPGLGRFSSNIYGLKVPHKGHVVIKTRVSAEPDGPLGDDSRDLPKLNPKEWVPDVRNPDVPNDDPKPVDGKTDKPGGCFPVILALALIPGLGLATYLTS
jgi:hypothetical protein